MDEIDSKAQRLAQKVRARQQEVDTAIATYMPDLPLDLLREVFQVSIVQCRAPGLVPVHKKSEIDELVGGVISPPEVEWEKRGARRVVKVARTPPSR